MHDQGEHTCAHTPAVDRIHRPTNGVNDREEEDFVHVNMEANKAGLNDYTPKKMLHVGGNTHSTHSLELGMHTKHLMRELKRHFKFVSRKTPQGPFN